MHHLTAPATAPAESSAGDWLANPVTGELARLEVAPSETAGRRLVACLILQPGAAVAGEHVHPHLVERFEVLDGEVGFRLAGAEWSAGPGDPVVEVAAGVAHDWWNAGSGVAHVRLEVEAVPTAPGRPAARFVSMIETLWSLGALGQVDAKGMPGLLWLAAIGREYRDVIRFTRPPAVVQAAVFGPLAAIARLGGREPLDPRLHGRTAPCALAEHGHAAWLTR